MASKFDPNLKKKGLVKGIPSADIVVFQGPVGKDGVPIEKTIRLNGIRAPLLGDIERPDRKEEPFAYEAREFLRNKIIGKQVFFYTENKIADREFGRILLDDEDLGESLLSRGLARLVDEIKPQPANYSKYSKVADDAYDAKKGIYSEDQALLASKTRKLNKIEDLGGFYEKHKGKTFKGIVEEFRNSLFNVYIPEFDSIIRLSLQAVFIPMISPKHAIEVRCFLDTNFLQRDVEITLSGFDERGNYFTGNIKPVHNPNYNAIKELVKEGYARLNSDAYKVLEPVDYKAIKNLQDEAQKLKTKIWSNFDTDRKTTSNTQDKDEEYQGRVVEVHSGDSLTVENARNGEQYRVYLANVRAPAIGNPKKGELPKPWAWEAKEYVRNQTIGKKVRVEVEFGRKIPVKVDEEATGEERDFTFVSIILPNDKNLSEQLVSHGFATVSAPRADDSFTKYIKQLNDAEEEAKKKKIGLHSAKTPLNPGKFTDYSQPKQNIKAKQFFEFVKNEPTVTGVVDAVLSGSLFKVRLEKNNCYVLFSLSGIRTYSNEKNVPQYEKFAKDALKYTKENTLQRDVELELNSVTPKGVFQGALFIGKKNFAHNLIEQGLAYVESLAKAEQKYAAQYRNVEKTAEDNKVGIWGAGIPVRSNTNQRGSRSVKPLNETKTVTVTEVVGPEEFYVHLKESKTKLQTIQAELEKAKNSESKLEQPVKKGIPCVARFSADGKWYRARIEKVTNQSKFGVVFTDYGNYDDVSYDDIRKISPALLSIEPQAVRCGLAYVEAPASKSDTYEDAAERLREFILEKEVSIQFVYEDGQTKYGVVSEKKGELKDSVNSTLIKEGLVRLVEDVVQLTNDQLIVLREDDEHARIKKLGGWATGDFSNDDDDY